MGKERGCKTEITKIEESKRAQCVREEQDRWKERTKEQRKRE